MRHFAQSFLASAIILAAFTIASPASAAALGLIRPFGGRVISVTTPGVTCPGIGPVTIQPVGPYPATPYYFPIKGTMIPRPGGWVLGNFLATPSPICVTQTPPPVPVPVLPVTLYGTSRI